jgi:hypothetical protein
MHSSETAVGAVRHDRVEATSIFDLVLALIAAVADEPPPAGCLESTWKRLEIEAFRIQDVVWRLPDSGPVPLRHLHSLAQCSERCRRALRSMDPRQPRVQEVVRLLTAIVEAVGLRSRAREAGPVYRWRVRSPLLGRTPVWSRVVAKLRGKRR